LIQGVTLLWPAPGGEKKKGNACVATVDRGWTKRRAKTEQGASGTGKKTGEGHTQKRRGLNAAARTNS